MTLLRRVCHLSAPTTFFLRNRGAVPSLDFGNLNAPALKTKPGNHTACQRLRMSTRSSSSDLLERDPKRRRVQRQTPPQSQYIPPFGTMASQGDSDAIQLELTEVESRLRQLLLDVADYIDNAPPQKDAAGVQVPKELADEKTVLRWTGGWVRDKLLKVGSHDIDLAINKMTGEHFGLKMQEYLEIPGNAEKHGLIDKDDKRSAQDKSKKIAPGLHKIEANPEKSKNLETATTKILGIDLDLVNLRKETYNEISRNPQMEFGTAEEDAMRRDATVNAMFYNLHTCQVEDFTRHGHDDMAAKIIRTPLEPYQTFKDDPLRVLRLIRFASRLDYVIEPETAKAMGNTEIQDVLKIKISRERVGIELEKMLRGPRPRMALQLIDRFGLYRTVFTDPTRQLPSDPETAYYKPAYDFVEDVAAKHDEFPDIIPDTLLRDADEKYLAWICATVMPWADAPTVPHPKPAQRPFFSAYLVAREGFKAPNKVCDVIASSLSNTEEIRQLVAQCAIGMRRPDTIDPTNNATARDTLGMALRRWGLTWRTQVFFNLVYEIVTERASRAELLRSYAAFLKRITELDILEVNTFKPLMKGTDLAKALETKPGPWMKDALDVVMAWQLRNPTATDPSEAIEAVKAFKSEKNESELPSRLASHFLQLTIPPFFPQSRASLTTLEASRQPKAWKEAGNAYVLDLLAWSIRAVDQKMIEAQWRFLIPPILKMIDDIEEEWKAKGCSLLRMLFDHLRDLQGHSVSTKPKTSRESKSFLIRTGYHNVFKEALLPLFTYIPSLTPEREAVTLFRESLAAVISLALLLPDEDMQKDNRNCLLDTIVRTGILSPLAHFPTPSTYPELATVIVSNSSVLVGHMGIETVKHLPDLIPMLSTILQEPFALSHTKVVIATLHAVQNVISNAWPRIPAHRGNILMGLCLLWGRCVEERGKSGGQSIAEIEAQIKEAVGMLDAIMEASEEEGLHETWEQEKRQVTETAPNCAELFGAECVG